MRRIFPASRCETKLPGTVAGIQCHRITFGGPVESLVTGLEAETDQEGDSVVEVGHPATRDWRKQGWPEWAPAGPRRDPPAQRVNRPPDQGWRALLELSSKVQSPPNHQSPCILIRWEQILATLVVQLASGIRAIENEDAVGLHAVCKWNHLPGRPYTSWVPKSLQ